MCAKSERSYWRREVLAACTTRGRASFYLYVEHLVKKVIFVCEIIASLFKHTFSHAWVRFMVVSCVSDSWWCIVRFSSVHATFMHACCALGVVGSFQDSIIFILLQPNEHQLEQNTTNSFERQHPIKYVSCSIQR